MKKFRVIIVILILILFGIWLLLSQLGFFREVIVQEKAMGPYMMVYEKHIGDYQESGVIQKKIYDELISKANIETFKGVGIYYDDPGEVATDKLRSEIGCILEEDDLEKIDMLKDMNFHIKEIASAKYLYAEFPYKNSLSIFMGIIKVYPVLKKYIADNKLTMREMIEIYDIPSRKIIYMMEL